MRILGFGLVTLCLFVPLVSVSRADEPMPAGVLKRLGSEDFRHPDARTADCTPDGKLWITAGKQIRLWDARTRKLVRTIDPNSDKDRSGILTMRIAGDGKSVWAITHHATIVAFDLLSGQERFRFKSDGLRFSVFDISHDAKVLAIGNADNQVILWDTATRKKLRTIEGDRRSLKAMQAAGNATPGLLQPIWVLALSPDAKWVAASAIYDYTVRVYDTATGKVKHAFPTNNVYSGWAGFSPDGAYLGMSRFTGPGIREGDEVLTVWDLATGNIHQEFGEPSFFGFGMSRDWKWLAADGSKGEMHVWERATGKRRCTIPSNPSSGLTGLALASDGATLVACNSTALDMWDTKTGRSLLGDGGHTGAICGVDISADGSVIASGAMDGAIILWDGKTGKVKHRFVQPRIHVTSIALSPDGRTLAASFFSSSVGAIIWDVATGKELHRISPTINPPAGVAFSPNGKTLAVSGTGNFLYQFFDVDTWKERRRFAWYVGQDWVNGNIPFRFSPDGNHFAGVRANQPNEFAISLWDMRKEEPRTISPILNSVNDLAFSPDGEYLAWANAKEVNIWDVQANKMLRTLKDTTTQCLAFTPDGRYLAIGKKLHPLDPKHPPLELPITPSHFAFSRDGRFIAAATQEGSAVMVLDGKRLGMRK